MVRVRGSKRSYPRGAVSASEFESLSPISFHTKEEFKESFDRLKIKQLKKGRERSDNSQENKMYQPEDGQPPKAHPERGAFEHGRIFYRILGAQIDPDKFNLHDVSWAQSAKIYSFAFSVRSADTRPIQDRISHPTLLDCGLAQATIPDLKYSAGSAIHFRFSNNRLLGAGSPKLPFQYGHTEELNDLAVSERLKDFFATTIFEGSAAGSRPVILLVHNETVALNALKNLGVDTTSWKSGLKALFDLAEDGHENEIQRRDPRQQYTGYGKRRERSPPRYSSSGSYQRQNYNEDYHRTGPDSRRQRSSSPRQHYNGEYRRNGHDSRRQRSCSPIPSSSGSFPRNNGRLPSPPIQRKSFAPVYVVDLMANYTALVRSTHASERVALIAGPDGLGLADINGWCAGNDVVTMLQIWHAMVSGPSINVQRELRDKNRDPKARAAMAAATTQHTGTQDDDEFDPRTIRLQPQVAVSTNDDSDSDYGESD
ncbi:hypothetical protein C0991_006395 [Blastosporella zonata]|nr:hypothetical protein C0991_006395 [Blastosporella zonata]